MTSEHKSVDTGRRQGLAYSVISIAFFAGIALGLPEYTPDLVRRFGSLFEVVGLCS